MDPSSLESDYGGAVTPTDFTNLNDTATTTTAAAECDYSEWNVTPTLIPIVYSLVFVCGLVGNGLVVWTIARLKTRKRNTDLYIASLASADLVFVLTLPLWAAYTALDYHWPFGGFLCTLSSCVVMLNMYASIFCLTCLSLDRYEAVVCSRPAGSPRGRRTALRRCAVIWLSALVASLPSIIFSGVSAVEHPNGGGGGDVSRNETDYSYNSDGDGQEMDDSYRTMSDAAMMTMAMTTTTTIQCSASFASVASPDTEHLWAAGLSLTSTGLGFVLPGCALLFFYARIMAKIQSHFTHVRRESRKRRRLLRVIATLVVTFLACWLPYHLLKTLDALVWLDLLPMRCGLERAIFVGLPFALCWGFVNSCLNPVLYAYFDVDFRARCASALGFACPPRTGAEPPTTGRSGCRGHEEPPSGSSGERSRSGTGSVSTSI
ncbi:apelin receptor A-like [Lethenteron reissneri]|uniref:apelin receptor A-like n=1 Tax=Lethenteron reissneri TaxID=7753 RepID=UPI002AB61D9B|nr:apelin receptor A-like [Lethenteron reissneri]